MSDSRQTAGTWVTSSEDSVSEFCAAAATMTVVEGPDQGQRIDVARTTRIGASAGCELRLSDPRVSGIHCEVVAEPTGFLLRDLDSTNGTRVQGHRVREIYLNAASIIQVGRSNIQFQRGTSNNHIPLSSSTRVGDLVATSAPMRALFRQIEQIAPTELSVLIVGETGTGKELVADAVHRLSGRADGPLEVFDCGSVAANLIESELFGFERGAFTGADRSRAGIFERAAGGTVFLDELGELPLAMQPKLLGVLERREVRRVGGERAIPVDVRVVSATNRDLAREINKKRFREDLYHRVAGMRLVVPPLRDHPDDVPLLARHFAAQLSAEGAPELPDSVLGGLAMRSFPGNVRELRNLVERALVTSDLSLLELGSPMAASRAAPAASERTVSMLVDDELPFKQVKGRVLAQLERRYMARILDRLGGNISRIAREAGLDRMTIYKMLKRTGLTELAEQIRARSS